MKWLYPGLIETFYHPCLYNENQEENNFTNMAVGWFRTLIILIFRISNGTGQMQRRIINKGRDFVMLRLGFDQIETCMLPSCDAILQIFCQAMDGCKFRIYNAFFLGGTA